MRCWNLETIFENLGEHDYNHDKVSSATPKYNCIAWAAGETDKRWWPINLGGYWWPPQLPKEETKENFIRAFELQGYVVCGNPSLQSGIEKVAIFVDDLGIPTHAARQLESGVWTSKCGQLEDIEHMNLSAMEGKEYGRPVAFLKRRRDRRPLFASRIRTVFRRLLHTLKPSVL